jgi:Flp pilus assembly pilin Flp
MLSLYSKVRALWATRDQGVTTVEYALLIMVIAGVVVGAVWILGGGIADSFTNNCNTVTGSSC